MLFSIVGTGDRQWQCHLCGVVLSPRQIQIYKNYIYIYNYYYLHIYIYIHVYIREKNQMIYIYIYILFIYINILDSYRSLLEMAVMVCTVGRA